MSRVLVVDDSVVLRASVKHVLGQAGYAVIEASDGQDGLATLTRLEKEGSRPEMILTDVNMPKMDGLTFLSEVKKKPEWRFIPVLVLTTESQMDVKEKGRALGAVGWLVKPFKDDQLVGVVRKFVRT
jgi:two-component system chemotaxis response regulator CheY